MDQQKRDLIRAAAYEQTRNDLRGSQRTKTSKRVNCNPPNQKCGGRCIPPTWDCRLKGQGTNRELKVHGQDISAGVASTQRGVANIIKAGKTLNPELFERGRKSVIRGVVKIAPGDNLEDKKRLRRRLEKNTALIAGVVSVGLAGSSGYLVGRQFIKRDLRRQIERPAINAFNAVLDRAPIIGASRARTRAAGAAAASTVGETLVREARLQGAAAAAAGNTQGLGPLGFRPLSSNTLDSGLFSDMDKVNKNARERGRSFDEWRASATETLFGAKTPDKHSIYSETAANEYLTSRFGLSNKNVGRESDMRQATRNRSVEEELGNKLVVLGEDLNKDRRLRGIEKNSTYIREVALPRVAAKLGGFKTPQRNAALKQARELMTEVMKGDDGAAARAYATDLRKKTVEEYDKYFGNVAAAMSRSAGTAANKDSPLGDGYVALARYELSRRANTSPRIQSRSHSDLLLREYYHTKVMKQRGKWGTTDDAAIRVAQQLTKSTTTPTVESAFNTLRTNGMPNVERISTVRRERRVATEAERARAIRARPGNEGMTQAAALTAARGELKREQQARGRSNRGDAMPPRVASYLVVREDLRGKSQGQGKPCGESHIPKAHKCTKKRVAPAAEGRESERSADYRLKQAASAGLRVAAVAGGATLVGAVLSGKLPKKLDKETQIQLALAGLVVTAAGIQSLKNEYRSTKTPAQFAADIKKLDQLPDADPAIVAQLAAFTEEAGIDQQRVGISQTTLLGLKGYFNTGNPDRLYATEKTKRGMTQKDYGRLGKVLQDHSAYRKSLSPEQQDARNIKGEAARQANHGPLVRFNKPELAAAHGTYVKVHELGHAVHYRGNFQTPKSVTLNGKTYTGDALSKELMKPIGVYGQSDMHRARKPSKTDYYSQGNRLETYAENFALYAMSGKSMKRDFPVAYEWTRLTTEKALSAPVKKQAVPMQELVATEGYKGFGKFDPYKKDAADKGWYSEMEAAAGAGDARKVIRLLADNGKGMNQVELEIALQWLESARVMGFVQSNTRTRDRGDAMSPRLATYLLVREDLRERSQKQGKPCGESYIPKAHKCSKNRGASGRGKAVAVAAGVGATALAAGALASPATRARLRSYGESVTASAKKAQYLATQEALSRSIDGLSSKQLRAGLNKLPTKLKAEAYELIGKAKLGAASMSLNLAGYEPVKVDTAKNYVSFKTKDGDIKSIGSVGDNLVSYTFHEVRGEAAELLPKGRNAKHVVFQIDRKFDQKQGVSTDDTKKIRSMLTSMFKDSVSGAKDGTLLLNTAWDKDGKGSGREALYRRYGFNSVSGIPGMQWAVVESGAVKRFSKSSAQSAFIEILEGS